MKWLTLDWWKYLLRGCSGIRQFFCRLRGHPYGVVWFNLYGNEPDMTCKNCGEDLG